MSLENFIPKEATQQIEFLKKYPEFDGRGIKIAIIDIDVADISLPGMQKTSTGLPKIIECLGKPEITVDTSKIVERNGKDFIVGLSGRKLKIPKKWKNPSDQWHLGSKPFEEICNKEMEVKCDGDINSMKDNEINVPSDIIIDFIVWFDGVKWKACIDTSLSKRVSNFEKAEVLSNFEEDREVAYLPNQMPYCVEISEDGNLLKVLWPSDSHGTLVTQIAAANFPENPEYNGLAPGAQILSIHVIYCKNNLEEAIMKCVEHGIDIINLSIHFPLTPEITQIFKKMVEEHEIIVIQAAGNEGPFYSSVPEQFCQISEQIFSIGAVFSSDKANSANGIIKYEVCKESSKGPLPSGARGIDFVAPGDAVADLPKWYADKSTAGDGTSFAAANVAGSIACLLSALKASSIKYSPAMIKLALANTAFLPTDADKLAFGHGIIQIFDAFEFIKSSLKSHQLTGFVPISMNESEEQKGIIHFQDDKNRSKNYHINIDPEFNENWILKCTSTNAKNFVTLSVTVKNNSFTVKIDTNLLEEGSINYTEIVGIDSSNPSLGPLFYLPITVICPVDSFGDKNITVNPGPPSHFFFKIPANSQKCSIKITSLEKEKKEILLGFRQKRSSCWCGEHHNMKMEECVKFTVRKNTQTLLYDLVENDNHLFEICLSHKYSTAFNIKMDVNF